MTGSRGNPGSEPRDRLHGRNDVPSWRLLTTLGTAGAAAGLLIVLVFRATEPAIEAHKAEVLRQAIQEVLEAPDRYDTLFVYGNALHEEPAEGIDVGRLEQVYVGYRAAEVAGFAIVSGKPGFQDVIRLIFGFDPATGTVLGMQVLESKETPGLGDKIQKDSAFVRQFQGAEPPLVGVKQGQAGDDRSKVDMITGATISSRTVIRIIDEALQRLGPLIAAYLAGQ